MIQDGQLLKGKYPLLFKLLVIFVFFLPLRSVQIPADVFGFEINPARIVSALFTILLFMNICIDIHYLGKFFRSGRYHNPCVLYFFIYALFSIAYYYILVALGKTILFGAGETDFLQNWRGRPFAQLLALVTYGIIPFYLMRYYAQHERARRVIERAFTWAILVLLYFALLQVITYIIFKIPLVGRQLFEPPRDLGTVSIWGIPFYRVHSLAGEPRDFGTFLLGAIPFYAYVRYGAMRTFTKINIVLMVIAFFLTTSSSALAALGFFLVAILADAIYRRRARLRFKYVKYGLLFLMIGASIFYTQLADVFGKRTIMMYKAMETQLLNNSQVQPLAQAQAPDLAIIYYLLNVQALSPVQILVGSGYSNFTTPIVGILEKYFHSTIDKVGVFNPNVAVGKLLVEGGVIGFALFMMMFVYTLKINTKLLQILRARRDKLNYNKALLLRLAFIAFFISGAIQNAYYYFIPMGLIVGWLNGLVGGRSPIRKV